MIVEYIYKTKCNNCGQLITISFGKGVDKKPDITKIGIQCSKCGKKDIKLNKIKEVDTLGISK